MITIASTKKTEYYMNIKLPKDLEQFMQEQIKNGNYNSRGEMIVEALTLLKEECYLHNYRIEELNRKIEEGLEDVRQGRVSDSKEVYKRLKSKIDKWDNKTREIL